MSVRAVIAKAVRHGRQVFLGVGRKKRTKPGFYKSEGQSETAKAPHRLLNHHAALQQQQQLIQKGQSVIARNLQSCTYLSLAAELRRQAAIRLSGNLYGRAVELSQLARSRLPIYAFVALGFAAHQNKDDEPDFGAITENIRNILETKSPSPPEENLSYTDLTLESYELGPMIGKGCNAAVHLAKKLSNARASVIEDLLSEEESEMEEDDDLVKFVQEDPDRVSQEEQLTELESQEAGIPTNTEERKTNYDLAIKMMFNYNIESDADAIWREMRSELVPARNQQGHDDLDIWHNGNHVKKKQLKPHPNIVDMQLAFVDNMPALAESSTEYPLALPPRIQQGGCGRNKTLFAVMKRYEMTLHDYLHDCTVGWFEGTCLLAQLVEAVTHLNQAGIAHRDLKTNNILLNFKHGQVPELVLSDFGSCLDEPDCGLRLPYQTDQVNRGGNPCLMAPEISSAVPGPHAVLDYSNADMWAVGAIAYEIFGGRNPFYGDNDNILHSISYNEEDLPPLPDGVPPVVRKIIKLMLTRDPIKRPSASQVADLLHLVLWSPRDWFSSAGTPGKSRVMHWLLVLTTEVIIERSFQGSERSTCQLKETFLNRISFEDLLSSLDLLYAQI